MSRITIKNLTKKFGSVLAVDNLSLDIPSGTFFTFVGPSGCGKSTTLRSIAGLETPDDGEIWFDDRCIFSGETLEFVPARKRGLGLVFQSYALWPHMNVFENVAFSMRLQKTKQSEVRERVQEVLDRVQISDLGERFPHELSGGQQQRVSLARELVASGGILLLDEPLSNLDARLRMNMRTELKRLHQDTKKTMIYVTHDQMEALTLSDQIAVMKEGVIQQVGTSDEVYFEPANLFVAEFLGLNPLNRFSAVVGPNELRVGEHAIHIESSLLEALAERRDSEVTVAFRPEHLRVLPPDSSDEAIPARVLTTLTAGTSVFFELEIAELETQLLVQEFEARRYAPGEEVQVGFERDKILVFDPVTGSSLTQSQMRVSRAQSA